MIVVFICIEGFLCFIDVLINIVKKVSGIF